MSPRISAELSSSEEAMTVPVVTTFFALPTEEPVSRASSEESSSLRERAAMPKETSLAARA